jgi:hypothetical protein
MLGREKRTLFDISVWNDNGSWTDWNLGNVPQHLAEQAQVLITLLKGATTIQKTRPDNRGWGSQGYSVTTGYNQRLDNTGGHQSSTKWKNIWNRDSLPKINFFN